MVLQWGQSTRWFRQRDMRAAPWAAPLEEPWEKLFSVQWEEHLAQ